MIDKSKLALIAALAAVTAGNFAAPALAQSRSAGERAFAAVLNGDDSNDPAMTGGGSTGYNESVLKDSG